MGNGLHLPQFLLRAGWQREHLRDSHRYLWCGSFRIGHFRIDLRIRSAADGDLADYRVLSGPQALYRGRVDRDRTAAVKRISADGRQARKRSIKSAARLTPPDC